jgi:1,2-diacylglycerol 3-alpha-glucosyltransferase
MKIAFFADNFYPELSGVSDSISFTIRELAKQGHQVEIFVPRHPRRNYKIGNVPYKEIDLGPNVKINRLPSLPIPMPTLQGRVVFPNFFRSFFIKTKFDIVHTHSFWGPGIDAKTLAKRQKIPLIGTNHTIIESFSPIDNKFVKSSLKKYVIGFFNKCAFVTAPSPYLLQNMIMSGLKSLGQAVPNPIEDIFFSHSESREVVRTKLGLKGFTILYTGRISSDKNIGTLIKAFIEFCKNKEDANLIIIGQGSERKALEKLASESPVSKQIKFLGPYLGEERKILFDYFHASDIFAIPSTSENQSMCVLQAMANGLPTLAANSQGLPELVNKERGLLFEPYDSDTLCKEIEQLFSSKTLRDDFSKNARIFAETLRASRVAAEWEKVYTSTIKKYKNDHNQ